jgi:hypothetical protein
MTAAYQLSREPGFCTAERPADPRARVERIVHEAMLTMRTLQMMDASRRTGCWPDYVYEPDDYGYRPSLGELRALRAPWRPTPRHITEMERVFLEWLYGQGLRDWQWMLLELRAFLVIFRRKGGWRGVADVMAQRPGIPSYSHTWLKYEHQRLIDVAALRAVALGHV